MGAGRGELALKVWQERFPWTRELAVSVNLNAKQLSTDGLIERVESELAATDLEPRCLRLEITEVMIIENPELTLALLSRLRGTSTTSEPATHRSPSCTATRSISSRSTAPSSPGWAQARKTSRSSGRSSCWRTTCSSR